MTCEGNVAIVSLGQLTRSDISKSIECFATALAAQGRWFAKERVTAALFLDSIWHHTIDAYKRGTIGDEAFRRRINAQLGAELGEEEFRNAWNAMCGMSTEDIGDIRALNTFLVVNNITLIIASATNPMHVQYFHSQLQREEITLAKIIESYSCDKRTLDQSELAMVVLKDNESIPPNAKIVSFHNGIRVEGVNVFPVDTREASLIEAMQSAFGITVGRNTSHEEGEEKEDTGEKSKFVEELEKKRGQEKEQSTGCIIG